MGIWHLRSSRKYCFKIVISGLPHRQTCKSNFVLIFNGLVQCIVKSVMLFMPFNPQYITWTLRVTPMEVFSAVVEVQRFLTAEASAYS